MVFSIKKKNIKKHVFYKKKHGFSKKNMVLIKNHGFYKKKPWLLPTQLLEIYIMPKLVIRNNMLVGSGNIFNSRHYFTKSVDK